MRPDAARAGMDRYEPEDEAPADHPIYAVVVDDRPRARHALRALLETCPDVVVVGEATDGAHALEVVALRRPDVVLMDLSMPVLDGFQSTARIKQRWPRVRVLALSVAADAREQALAAGADAFVAKGAS